METEINVTGFTQSFYMMPSILLKFKLDTYVQITWSKICKFGCKNPIYFLGKNVNLDKARIPMWLHMLTYKLLSMIFIV